MADSEHDNPILPDREQNAVGASSPTVEELSEFERETLILWREWAALWVIRERIDAVEEAIIPASGACWGVSGDPVSRVEGVGPGTS